MNDKQLETTEGRRMNLKFIQLFIIEGTIHVTITKDKYPS